MAENPQSPLELNMSEWEFLHDNTSCLELGLEDFKTLISNEVMDTDYFRSEPCEFIQQFSDINNQDEEEETKIKPKEKEPMNCTKSARSVPKQCTPELSVQEADPPPPYLVVEEKIGVQEEEEEEEEKEMKIWEGIRVGNWKCRLTAVGALCSIGAAAAATICVLALDGREVQQPPHRCRRRSSVAQFRIHRDNKMPAGVAEKAGKLNQAAARSMPAMARAANISFGRYYSGPLINSRLSPSDDTCSCSFRGR